MNDSKASQRRWDLKVKYQKYKEIVLTPQIFLSSVVKPKQICLSYLNKLSFQAV